MPAFPRFDSAGGPGPGYLSMATMVAPRATSPEEAFQKFVVEAWSLLSAAVFVTVIRMVFRITGVGIRNLCWDDYLICIGSVRRCSIATAAFHMNCGDRSQSYTQLTDMYSSFT